MTQKTSEEGRDQFCSSGPRVAGSTTGSGAGTESGLPGVWGQPPQSVGPETGSSTFPLGPGFPAGPSHPNRGKIKGFLPLQRGR